MRKFVRVIPHQEAIANMNLEDKNLATAYSEGAPMFMGLCITTEKEVTDYIQKTYDELIDSNEVDIFNEIFSLTIEREKQIKVPADVTIEEGLTAMSFIMAESSFYEQCNKWVEIPNVEG